MDREVIVVTSNSDLKFRIWKKLCDTIFFTKNPGNNTTFAFWCTLYALFFVWGISFMNDTNFETNPYGSSASVLHYVSLPFHEAGHIIFAPLGSIMHSFGGTLLQLLVPVIVMIRFIRRKEMLESSICLWWLGFNFLDISPYIYDAFDKKLVLLGGVTGMDNPDFHDWSFILTSTNNMQYHDSLAYLTGNVGKGLIILSILWGGFILKRQFDLLKQEV